MSAGVLAPQRPEFRVGVGGNTVKDQHAAGQEMVMETLQRQEVLLPAGADADDATGHNRLVPARQIEIVQCLPVQLGG